MSDEEIDKMTVKQLKNFLKSRGLKSTGLKNELQRLVRIYKSEILPDTSTNDIEESELKRQRMIFDSDFSWTKIEKLKKSQIPEEFDYFQIHTFLTQQLTNDHENDLGTEKPAEKGRHMYRSNLVNLCEFVFSSRNILLVRGEIQASMERKIHQSYVGIEEGVVFSSKCSCKARIDGRCVHVACLLYVLDDVKLGIKPQVGLSCTSLSQEWGKGKPVEKDPKPFHLTNYNQKTPANKYYDYDPR